MQCKQCGESLPENARFCFHCGAQVPEESLEPAGPPPGPPPDLDFVQPGLSGGLFLGLLSSIPIISAANCLCCMWVLAGGSMATMLLKKQQPRRILTYGDGAFAGVLSGLFGAIVATMMSIPMKILSARLFGSQQESIENMLKGMPEVEGPMRDLVMRVMSPEISVTTVLFTFISNLIIYSLFAMVGGILTILILNKKGGSLQQPPPNQFFKA